MKLYTEKEIRTAMATYMSPSTDLIEQVIQTLTPIELPSDLKDFHEWIENNEWYFNPISFNGVIKYRWVKEFWSGQETTDELYKIYIEEQILNQNK